MSISHKKIQHFQHIVLDRYAQHKRDLPWRQTINPYEIRVSEIMLQQTQVDRVIPKYLNFLALFPTLKKLADTDKTTLLTARSGLGYNSRALNLQKAAQVIMNEYGGTVPNTIEQLKKLPGVWPYTAGAICAFAFNQEVPVVDINIKRVLIHTFGLDETISSKELETIALQCVPEGKSCERHNALMDYGSSVLTSKKTGIKSAKQSTFQWSQRQVRGNIIKYLTKYGKLSIVEAKKLFPHDDFDTILEKMISDWLVLVHDGVIGL